MIWIGLVIGLIVGLVGGFFLGVWVLRRSMTNMDMDDKDLAAMAKRMGVNLNPRQLQLVKQQMKKSNTNPPPLFGRRKKNNTTAKTGVNKSSGTPKKH